MWDLPQACSPGAHAPGTASQDRRLSCGHSSQPGDAVRAWHETHQCLLITDTVMAEGWNGWSVPHATPDVLSSPTSLS